MSETVNASEPVPEPESDWLKELQQEALAKGQSPVLYLPVLGLNGYMRRGRCHLLAGYAKSGKTELMTSIMLGWPEERVLYVSEEDREVWYDRMLEVPEWPGDVKVTYSLGWPLQRIMNECLDWDGSVIVIDTLKLLGIEEENDPATVQAALAPFVKMARLKKVTLILMHHANKHGGSGGRAVSGSHAFVSIVDIFLEIDEVPHEPEDSPLRHLSGRGKIKPIERLLYEKDKNGDGLMYARGPAIIDANLAVQNAMSTSWQNLAEVSEHCGLGTQAVYRRVMELVKKGKAERDPPMGTNARGQRADGPPRYRLT